MSLKAIEKFFLSFVESGVFSNYYFSLSQRLRPKRRWTILGKFILLRIFKTFLNTEYEINALIYSKADERMLIPIVYRLLEQLNLCKQEVRVNLVLFREIRQDILDKLILSGCNVETDHFSLLKACLQPQKKLVLLCLDHRFLYEFHKWGVDTADTLRKFGVKTVSIQHGGTREDCVKGLSSSASDIILVWGERVFRELVYRYKINSNKLRIVGNPLHDRISLLNKEKVMAEVAKVNSSFYENILSKKIILLATCLHTEYLGRENEQDMYANYLKHLYNSLDFSKIFLIIKMHPVDKANPNLYEKIIPEHIKKLNSILIVEPESSLDVYSLLYISDLLITRASTVAEEALLMKKKVIAFDLDRSGPSEKYRYLEEYGHYHTVYAYPEKALSDVISQALFSSQAADTHKQNLNLEKEITYSLDGNSTNRAVNEILKILYEGKIDVKKM